MTDTAKLKAAIIAKGYRQEDVAKKLNISTQSLNYKINNKRDFRASEIEKLKFILDIENIDVIFFAQSVDLNATNKYKKE